MDLLLDTHVLLWCLTDSPRLPAHFKAAIADTANGVFVSTISFAEVSLKASLGKLDAPRELADQAETDGFSILGFAPEHALALRDVPWHHRDPFDRMLIAQAVNDGLTFVTVDDRIRQYDVPLL